MLSGEAYTIDNSPFITQGHYYVVSVGGTTSLNGVSNWTIGDWVIAGANNEWTKLDHSQVDGTGTTGNLTKWSSTSVIADSIVSESGTAITVDGSLTTNTNLSSTGNFQVGTGTGKFSVNSITGNGFFEGDVETGRKITIADLNYPILVGKHIAAGNGDILLSIQGQADNTLNAQIRLNRSTDDYGSIDFLTKKSGGISSSVSITNNTGDVYLQTGDLHLIDAKKAYFGAGNDLEIYHDGSNSYINDTGTGRLIIKSDYFEVDNAAGTEAMIEAIQDGAVSLYYNASKKFETTSTGVSVTGGATFTDDVTINNSSPELYFTPAVTKYSWMIAAQENVDNHFEITPSTTVGGSTFNAPALKINGADNAATFAGEISQIYNPGNTGAFQYLKNANAGSSAYVSKKWQNDDSGFGEIWRNSSTRNSGAGSTVSSFNMYNSAAINFWPGGSLGLTLDASQNATFAGTITSGALSVGSSGTSRFTDTNAFPLQLNRGLDVDVFGANGCILGIGSLKGSTYIDGTRISGGIETNGTDGSFIVQTLGGGSYTTALTINSSQNSTFAGKVGIGGSPTAKISILAPFAAATQAAYIEQGEFNQIGLQVKNTNAGSSTTGILQVDNSAGTAFIVNGSGNVGIGTDSPDTLVNIEGSSPILTVEDNRTSIGTGTIMGRIDFKQNDDSGSGTGVSGSIYSISESSTGQGSGLAFSTGIPNSATEKMRITSGGDVQIKSNPTSSPYEGMIVENLSNGCRINIGRSTSAIVLGFYNDNGIVGSISTSGSSTVYTTSSDYRLKEDLQDFAGLDMISKIPVYDFKWKSDESRSYGVMAHELQEVLPDAVSGQKDAEEMQGVDYSKIVPLLVKSIQELKAEVDLLKQECKCKN